MSESEPSQADGVKSAETPRGTVTRRIRVKGHYRVMTWNEKGHIVSAKKWSSKSKKDSENTEPRREDDE